MPAPPTEWKSFQIQVPGIDLLEQVRGLLETLLVFLEVLKAILETVKIFLIDFGNPIKPIVEALIKLILDFIEALRRTGLYLYYDVPDFTGKDIFKPIAGGFQGFLARWKGSLLDTKDANRPKPVAGALTGGFVLILADSFDPTELLRIITILLSFFNLDFAAPQFPAPANLKAGPIGADGNSILSVAKVFREEVGGIALEWTLPSNTPPADPSFSNMAANLAQEFFPPKWLIEISADPVTAEVDFDAMDNESAGYCTQTVETQMEVRGIPNKRAKRKIRLKDVYGDPFIRFQRYAIIDPSTNPASFFLGQLGKFRWIHSDAEKDKTYYYRVRAFAGEIPVKSDNTLTGWEVKSLDFKEHPGAGGNKVVIWPGGSAALGKPSKVIRARMTTTPTDFNVLENIRRVLLVGLSFDFHDEPEANSKFDNMGMAIPPTPDYEIGRGSLTGKVTLGDTFYYLAAYIVGTQNPAAAATENMPWQQGNVRWRASRHAIAIASAMLEAGSDVILNFQNIMQGTLPQGSLTVGGTLTDVTTLEGMVEALTKVDFSDSSWDPEALETITEVQFATGTVSMETVRTYGAAYMDGMARANLLVAVRFLMNLAYSGVPPNWEQVSLLRDVFPWSGQLLYELIEKIQALLDAFKGILDEIKAFIDMIIRKINALEEFIKFLISILDFIASLQVGFYFLSATGLTGDVTDWFGAVDNATGDAPLSGSSGYTTGICLAYLAVNVAAFEAAFKLIF